MNDDVVQFAIQVLKTSHIQARIVDIGEWDNSISFDLGLREGLQCTEIENRIFYERLQSLSINTIYHITDSFGCLYTILLLPESKNKIVFIGPTLENEDYKKLSEAINEKKRLSPKQSQQLQHFYLRLPKLSLITGYHSVVLALGKHLYGEKTSVRYIQDQTDPLYYTEDYGFSHSSMDKPIVSMQMLEERYEIENGLLDAVRQGNNFLALQAYERFSGITIPNRSGIDVPTSVQYHIVALNALLRKEAERCKVHPLFLDELSEEIISAAPTIKTEETEYRATIHLIDSYCTLIKRFSMSNYSPIVRNVAQYAHSHISEDLSLRTLATKFNVNRSYLSSLFKKETGKQFTEYINGIRIEYAASLITKQQVSISEAAAIVGIFDVPYFTRLFKRIKNKPPAQFVKEYRNYIHNNSEDIS